MPSISKGSDQRAFRLLKARMQPSLSLNRPCKIWQWTPSNGEKRRKLTVVVLTLMTWWSRQACSAVLSTIHRRLSLQLYKITAQLADSKWCKRELRKFQVIWAVQQRTQRQTKQGLRLIPQHHRDSKALSRELQKFLCQSWHQKGLFYQLKVDRVSCQNRLHQDQVKVLSKLQLLASVSCLLINPAILIKTYSCLIAMVIM